MIFVAAILGWYTPRKINIEPGNDGLKDLFSSSRGVFSGSMLTLPIRNGMLQQPELPTPRPSPSTLDAFAVEAPFDQNKSARNIR